MMQRALSTYLFASQRLTPALLDQVYKAGIPLVEIHSSQHHIDYRNRAQISELSLWLRDSPLKVYSVHSPIYKDEQEGPGPRCALNIAEPVKAKRVVIVDEIKRALETADRVPFRYLIQHLGASGDPFHERSVDAAVTSLEELKLFAKHLNVEILLENIPNGLSTCEALLTFLQRTHLDLNFCLDVGHAHLYEGVSNAYKLLQGRIRSTHVHDNNGKEDLHQSPFEGSIDWAEAMELLRSNGDQYPLLLELKEVPETPNLWDDIHRVFDRLEEMKPRYES